MPQYHRRDIAKLRKIMDDLRRYKNHHLFNILPLTNALERLGFERVVRAKGGSHIPYRHELLTQHKFLVDGIFNLAVKGGKKNQMSCYDFRNYCEEPIEFVLDRMENERLIVENEINEE